MEPLDEPTVSYPPSGRSFSRYKPLNDSSDYPRRNGGTSVDDLMQDKAEAGNGECRRSSESSILQGSSTMPMIAPLRLERLLRAYKSIQLFVQTVSAGKQRTKIVGAVSSYYPLRCLCPYQ